MTSSNDDNGPAVLGPFCHRRTAPVQDLCPTRSSTPPGFDGGVTQNTPTSRGIGPTRLAERHLAPDLIRGLMLLLIAVANSHHFLAGRTLEPSPGAGFAAGGSVLDSVVAGTVATLVDSRAYPLFALLFGYGLAWTVQRQTTAGAPWPRTRRLLRRRGGWLVVIGVLHAVLLYLGDILAAYGVLALVFAGAVRWRGRTLAVWAGASWLLGSVLLLPTALEPVVEDLTGVTNLLSLPGSTLEKIGTEISLLLLLPIGLLPTLFLGFWAARRGILADPGRQLPLLRWTAVLGIGAAVLGGLPNGLAAAGVLEFEPGVAAAWVLTAHQATGYLGGLGYAAALALLAVRIGARRGPLVRALVATGQRSMTCYLAQSVVWLLAFAPFAADLGQRLGTAATAGLAVATWALTVGLAELLRRAGWRGPFEALFRRVVYGRG